jgi:hypothetical protein
MAKTTEIYVTVDALRRWLDGQNHYGVSIPSNWTLHRTDYGFVARHPDHLPIAGEGFSLVPEDAEDEA